MTSPADTAIRRRPDGSIDTSFYMDRGRRARSDQAHSLVTAERSARPRRTWSFSFLF